MLYKIFAVASIIIRNFYLPNPFECFGDKAIWINFIAEPIIHAVSFGLVGLVYAKGSAPTLGSFLYLLTYCAITGILLLMSIFSFAWWWILTIIFIAILLVVGIRLLGEKISRIFSI